MTHAIHRPPAMTMTMTNTHTKTKTKTKTEKFQEKLVNEYRFKYPMLMNIGCDVLAYDTHCQLQDKDKDRMLKRPNIYAVFEKQGVRGYQI